MNVLYVALFNVRPPKLTLADLLLSVGSCVLTPAAPPLGHLTGDRGCSTIPSRMRGYSWCHVLWTAQMPVSSISCGKKYPNEVCEPLPGHQTYPQSGVRALRAINLPLTQKQNTTKSCSYAEGDNVSRTVLLHVATFCTSLSNNFSRPLVMLCEFSGLLVLFKSF